MFFLPRLGTRAKHTPAPTRPARDDDADETATPLYRATRFLSRKREWSPKPMWKPYIAASPQHSHGRSCFFAIPDGACAQKHYDYGCTTICERQCRTSIVSSVDVAALDGYKSFSKSRGVSASAWYSSGKWGCWEAALLVVFPKGVGT
jgi:hypothetical protein